MTMTLGELADLGEPKRYEIYTNDLPVSRRDECQETFGAAQFVCNRWFDHFGDHADVSTSGLVLEVWENIPDDPYDSYWDDDTVEVDCEECRDAYERDDPKVNHRIHRLSKDVRDAYRSMEEIAERLGEEIDEAKSKLRELRKKAVHFKKGEDVVEAIDYSQTTLDKIESDAMDLSVPEEDWT